MKTLLTTAATSALLLASSHAAVVINEVLASTTSADGEFIELYNSGVSTVDIAGWSILEYESDAGGSFGTLDDTFEIPDTSPIDLSPGAYYLIGNSQFITDFGITPDLTLGLSIENSSSTLILKDASDATIYSAFLNDGDTGDAPNEAGVSITPDISVGPDGSFLPAGYYLVGDAGSTAEFLEFSPKPAASATPGAMNIPEPSIAFLGALGLLGLVRRRR